MYLIVKNNKISDTLFKSESEAQSALKGADQKVISVWAACNHKPRGEGKPCLRPAIHRLVRRSGGVFYLAKFGETPTSNKHGEWGVCMAADLEERLQGAEKVVTGYTRNHAFHKLGKGCANRGAEIYWSW
jgi:hypothetical protein